MSFKPPRLLKILTHGRNAFVGGALVAWLGCFGQGSNVSAVDFWARLNLSATGIYFVRQYVESVGRAK